MLAQLENYLPKFVRSRINNHPNLRKIINNAGWLVFERVIHLGMGFMVSILIARYLGPQKFGILNYAISIVAFLSTLVYLGLSGIVVRDIVKFPDEKELLIGTTFLLKMTGSVVAFIVAVGIAMFTHGVEDYEFWVLVIVGLGLLARPFETIDFWFQARVESKYSVIAKFSAFVVAAAIKLILIYLGASIVCIAAAFSLELILVSVMLVTMYSYRGFKIKKWQVKFSRAVALFRESWIIILSGFFALANLKADQVMLRWIAGAEEVGIYSVAVTFSEVWYFIPTVIAMSVYPRLIELKSQNPDNYNKKTQQVFDVLFSISFAVALLMSVIAGPLIPLLYTDAYAESSSILIIHIWAGIFMFMRALFSKWVLIEKALFFSLMSHGLGALVNIVTNYFLIPYYGGKGAAIATLFSYAASSYLFLFLSTRTRKVAFQMSKSLMLPFRIAFYGKKIWV